VRRSLRGGRDSVRENTRREYHRLLESFALEYFDRRVHVRDLDRAALQRFTDWLTSRTGRNGRLCDRSIANALTPLRMALDAAVAEGLLEQNPAAAVVLQRRRGGRAWEVTERRFLTREELAQLLDEVPAKWRTLLDLLAATGLRVSEAIALRWSDLASTSARRGYGSAERSFAASPTRRSRATGARLVPLPPDLAANLLALRPPNTAAPAPG